MMQLIVLVVLFMFNCGYAEQQKISRDVSDCDKSSPLLWLLARQLDRVETRLTQLQSVGNHNLKEPTTCPAMEKKIRVLEQSVQSNGNRNINLTSEMMKLRNDLFDVINKESKNRKQINVNSIKISTLDKTNTNMQSELQLLKDGLKECQLNFSKIMAELKKKPEVHKGQCKNGWQYFSGHCYYLSTARKSWTDAKNDCLARKGYLVKVDNKEENDWLKARVTEHIWIGAHDSEVEGEWRWVSDNTIVSFTDWTKGEPSNSANKEDCAHFRTDTYVSWNDNICAKTFRYFCEIVLTFG